MTNTIFLERVTENFGKTIKCLTPFNGCSNTIDVQCLVCLNRRTVFARKLIEKTFSKCPNCSIQNRKSSILELNDNLLKRDNDFNLNYKITGSYVNSETHVQLLHLTCNKISNITPINLLKGRRCSFCCKGIKQTSTEWFKEKVDLETNSEYIFIGNYTGTHVPSKFFHKVCNSEFLKSPTNFFNKQSPQRCPVCSAVSTESKGEIKIRNFLESYNINFSQHFSYLHPDFKLDKYFNFDFKIDLQDGSIMFIEFFGELHYRSFSGRLDCERFILQQKRDKIKKSLCEKHGIPLVIISYKDYNKINDIMLSIFEL